MGAAAVDFILDQTELTCVFAAQEYINKLVTMKKDGIAKNLKFLVSFDQVTTSQVEAAEKVGLTLYTLQYVMEQGKSTASVQPFQKCGPDDCPLFSYTSGTTGDSKGAKMTHRNLLSAASSIHNILGVNLTPDDAAISYLPYPHIFENGLTVLYIIIGVKIGYYQGDPLKLTEDCAALQPAFFPSVPRLFNRIYSKIKEKLDGLTGCKGWLAQWATNTKIEALKNGTTYTNGCFDALVFKKVAALLGGQVRQMITGSAPIDPQVLDFLKICFSCPVYEGYGLTETSAAASCTKINDPLAGHVGGPLTCVKLRLLDVPEMSYTSADKPYPRGELCVKGPSVTSGYYKRKDKTDEAFDSQGWFKTGDIALVYPNGTIKIIDRSKNIFKLSQGEYIAPEKVENMFALSPIIAQSMVYGDSLRSCVVAIIVPHADKVQAWAKENGKQW